MSYNTLLLVVALRLGLEKLWPNDSVIPIFYSMVVEELATLYHPKKPTLAIKQVNHCHPLYEYLLSHSPAVEEVYMPMSDVAAFQNSMKFKNLRVMELGSRIPDKMLCSGLWNINKKSDKVLEMAIKDSKWRLDNKDGPDRGIMSYNTLLLVVALRLGLEKLWPNDSVIPIFYSMVVEELATLYHPKKPTLAIKQVNHCHPLYEYLLSHSPAVEEVYMPMSDVAAFQNSMKFKLVWCLGASAVEKPGYQESMLMSAKPFHGFSRF